MFKNGGFVMRRKLIFLSLTEESKDGVDNINAYFDKGYEIEKILDADCGYYIFLVLNNCGNYKYAIDLEDYKSTLIEEVSKKPECTTTNTIVNVEEIYKKPVWATTCTNIN